MTNSSYILVLFDSSSNRTKELAYLIAKGIESQSVTSRIRRVPKISSVCEATEDTIAEQGTPYVSIEDLKYCSGLALGSPTYFGNMSSHLKYFLEQTVPLWLGGNLCDKPACVFTSTGSMHGGHESTLISMMLPLIHHGMIILGLPYKDTGLMHTNSGCSPYGVSHLAEQNGLSEEEKNMAIFMGKRLAKFSQKILS